MQHPRPKVLKQPAHPAWRERKVSPKLHSTGYSIYRCTGESSMIYNPKGERRINLDLIFGRLYALDKKCNIPLFPKCPGCCIVYLTRSGWTLRHASFKVRIPPFIIIRWLCEQFPYIFNRSSHIRYWANTNDHEIHL